MSNATDPFEEYLRKKKVELLETKFRDDSDHGADPEDEDFRPPSNDDPEVEAKLMEEVDDFFSTTKNAGAQHFSEAGTGLPEEQVEEIRDALEDVFEEDAPKPRAEEDDQTFVDFFKQVRDEYSPGQPVEEPVEEQIEATAREIVAEAAPVAAPVADPEPHPTELGTHVGEVSTDEYVAVEVNEERVTDDSRLDLSDILTPLTDEADLLQRVELLGRLVGKLIERLKMPENEIIEVLIKSGVEF